MSASPVVAVHRALGGPVPARLQVAPGTTISDTKPESEDLLICRLNGGPLYVSRKDWGYRLAPGDVLEWCEFPQANDDNRGFLQIALAVVAAVVPAYGALIYALGNLAINLTYQPNQVSEREAANTSVYSANISGNQAKLYQAIPKICGRHQTFPPFAGQPYSEFDANGDQYFHAVYAVTEGELELERVLFDDTDIDHFEDILIRELLAPGVQPSVVKANVVTAAEVSGQDMLTNQLVGGFSACGPMQIATHIGIDTIAPRGLAIGDATTGALNSAEVRWRVYVRPLNEFGSATTDWIVLANETRTASSAEPQRWSVKYELPYPMRPEVRILRLDVKSSNIRALHDLVWAGLRAYLEGDAPLNPNVTHFELQARSSKQLNSVSQSRLSIIGTGKCRTLNSDGTFGALVATRNGPLWLADLWTNASWGEGVSASRCDLATLYTLSQQVSARQDRFDYVFDTSTDAESAAQLIANSFRARCFERNGVKTLARDEPAGLPVTAFSGRNTAPLSMQMSERLPTVDTPDGVIVEYIDHRSWDYGLPIECPAPGVVTMQNPVRVRLAGITGSFHAKREGLYLAAKTALRTRLGTCVTEMQGMLPAYMSPVRWQPTTEDYGQTGDVAFWDEATLVMGLTEPPAWGAQPLYITLLRDDGTTTEPVMVSPGGGAYDVVLPAAPDFTLVLDDGTRERPKFLLGTLETIDEIMRVATIEDAGETAGGAPQNRITVYADDDRIHTADNAFLPGPDEIQDPIDTSPGEPGGGIEPVINLADISLIGIGSSAPASSYYLLRANGTLSGYADGDLSGGTIYNPPGHWLSPQPAEAGVAVLFEVRATLQSGAISTGTFGTWLSLDTDRLWQAVDESGTMLVEIRDVATETVQDSATVVLHMQQVSGA